MKVAIAIDSFKGSLSSVAAGNAVEQAFRLLKGKIDPLAVFAKI